MKQRDKAAACRQLQEIKNEEDRCFQTILNFVWWRRNQRVYLRLQPSGPTHVRFDVVNTFGEPEVMSKQELYSLLVQLVWLLRRRVAENAPVHCYHKDETQIHTFEWGVTLDMPTRTGHRVITSLSGVAWGYYHVWFSGQAQILYLFWQEIFRQEDPEEGDAVPCVDTLLCVPPWERRHM